MWRGFLDISDACDATDDCLTLFPPGTVDGTRVSDVLPVRDVLPVALEPAVLLKLLFADAEDEEGAIGFVPETVLLRLKSVREKIDANDDLVALRSSESDTRDREDGRGPIPCATQIC